MRRLRLYAMDITSSSRIYWYTMYDRMGKAFSSGLIVRICFQRRPRTVSRLIIRSVPYRFNESNETLANTERKPRGNLYEGGLTNATTSSRSGDETIDVLGTIFGTDGVLESKINRTSSFKPAVKRLGCTFLVYSG
jgi:hypothetical protein